MSKPLTTEELAEIRETNTESPEWDPSDYVISRLLATIDKLETGQRRAEQAAHKERADKGPNMGAEPLTDEEMKLIRRSADHFYVPAEDLPRLVATIDRERERAERAEVAADWAAKCGEDSDRIAVAQAKHAEQAEASCATLRRHLALYAASDSLVAGVGDAAALLKELEALRDVVRKLTCCARCGTLLMCSPQWCEDGCASGDEDDIDEVAWSQELTALLARVDARRGKR